MNKCSVEFMDELPEEIDQQMSKDLIAYESEHGIGVNYKRFSLVLKSEVGEVIGVLNAFTAFAEIYIDDMWVRSSYRGKGYGTKLIRALEDMFKGKGFNNINLVTSAFQAPDFYRKCGFIEEFVRKNRKNPKLNKTFFVKYFDDKIQTQGILK